MGASRGLSLTQRSARTVGSSRTCNDLSTGVTENSRTGVGRGGRGCSAGEDSCACGVEVSSVCASQGEAEELDSPLARGACVVCVAVPTAGAGASKGFVGGREETREGGGASGSGDEGLGGSGESATGVGV
jgi:hypothetical protein